MSVQFNQAAQEGIYLRFPDNIAPQRELNYDLAINLLTRGMAMAQSIPFTWSYIDKPMDGSIYLLFHPVNTPYVIDGIRFQDTEVKYSIPAGARELEVQEIKYGFIPNFQDTNASRLRRRYRLIKGGNPQLMLVYYTRGPPTQIPPALMNQPVRLTPMRSINEPAMFVAGDKIGQKVYPPGVGPMHGGGGGASNMVQPPIGMGMNFEQQRAMLAQQNSSMEALEQRRRERERQQQQERAAQRPRMVEEEDSGDEVDMISTRTLALARYKRNHDWMNDVFNQAAFGKRSAPPEATPYSIFSKTEIEEKTAKLQAELEALQTMSAQRRADKIRDVQSRQGDVPMGESIVV
ncbi:hypothetical protein BDN70DRAFT_870852 [Pholiota conissans]|uniref:Uncharacterized protein n=1 Tax=Pholiota conissans TaxID=109636 RepID=A0A9P5ZCX0_9AGAR|nr:hypothetical protein BDN70DRAFT_870852 [Pholiota conissans]